MWYKKYEKLSSSWFNFENSGKRSGFAPPWRVIYKKDLDVKCIKGEHGMNQLYKVLGYTEQPPFPAEGYEAIAIMFESQDDFEKTWWHFPKDQKKNMEYYGIKTPEKENGKSYIWWISDSEDSSWNMFFTHPNKDGKANFYRAPLFDAKRAYKAIGYKCVKLKVEEIK